MAHYMLLLHQDPATNASMPPDAFKEIVQRYYAWSQKLHQQGRLVGGEKLAVGRARRVQLRDGKPLSSDGPYAEAKDVVGGYFVIEARDQAEADAIAKDCPHVALAATNWIEIRPIESMAQARSQAAAS